MRTIEELKEILDDILKKNSHPTICSHHLGHCDGLNRIQITGAGIKNSRICKKWLNEKGGLNGN